MQIKPLAPGQSSNEILFESYIIEDLQSFDELIDIYQDYKKNNPGKTIILTLDDLHQAEYTSTHSTMYNDLDQTEGYDLSGLDKACFENGEHIGYLSTPSEFFILKKNFLKKTEHIDFSSVCGQGLSIDENEISILEKINRSAFEFLDKKIILKIIPVEKPYEGICGFPNGYFSDDLNPFENYALSRHLFEKYGFELFGIGASFLGFIRKENLDTEQASELISDLAKLYNCNEAILSRLTALIQNSKYLFLKYTEYLEK